MRAAASDSFPHEEDHVASIQQRNRQEVQHRQADADHRQDQDQVVDAALGEGVLDRLLVGVLGARGLDTGKLVLQIALRFGLLDGLA